MCIHLSLTCMSNAKIAVGIQWTKAKTEYHQKHPTHHVYEVKHCKEQYKEKSDYAQGAFAIGTNCATCRSLALPYKPNQEMG